MSLDESLSTTMVQFSPQFKVWITKSTQEKSPTIINMCIKRAFDGECTRWLTLVLRHNLPPEQN